MMKYALSIAGSDSCAGAGIQADLKTFAANGVYGLNVITAITAQNTRKIIKIVPMSKELIRAQLMALEETYNIYAIKIGMLYTKDIIEEVCKYVNCFSKKNIILDPLVLSSSAKPLIKDNAKNMLINKLFPLVDLVTPNIMEASYFSGVEVTDIATAKKACRLLYNKYMTSILLKGGHYSDMAIDILYDGEKFTYFKEERLNIQNAHGTGCTFSSSIVANLTKGYSLIESINISKKYITNTLKNGFRISCEEVLLNHFCEREKE
jgi:hydroxymethylpyrimidine/phosphomethylpyrimidine kinase